MIGALLAVAGLLKLNELLLRAFKCARNSLSGSLINTEREEKRERKVHSSGNFYIQWSKRPRLSGDLQGWPHLAAP